MLLPELVGGAVVLGFEAGVEIGFCDAEPFGNLEDGIVAVDEAVGAVVDFLFGDVILDGVTQKFLKELLEFGAVDGKFVGKGFDKDVIFEMLFDVCLDFLYDGDVF